MWERNQDGQQPLAVKNYLVFFIFINKPGQRKLILIHRCVLQKLFCGRGNNKGLEFGFVSYNFFQSPFYGSLNKVASKYQKRFTLQDDILKPEEKEGYKNEEEKRGAGG